MKWIAIQIILIYQSITSFFNKKNSCKFYPTCSEYGKLAFQKHGFFKGFYLTTKRILKCHPWREHEIDLVP
ncbi:MAG: membrane protein insertion efficiency factor YidD [Candidatus Pacebacteria bacterium]|nr:membrane protein insertion efficiency factor YidD [Candidatus Paceibacterota bacterium]MBP9780926.1 membrane protein insertion efficiency factor YidD [Candidatus Paceibacterota bacterium]